MSKRPLEGIRVLSLAEQYPGPYATMLLADLGAEVIMVERPNGGDPTRKFPGLFNTFARNKSSITLDLKSSEGHKQFLELVKTADVVLEGYRPGVVTRLQISAADLQLVKPDLIYVSISAFGQTGPDAHMVGHDLSIQACTGMLHIEKGQEATTPLPILPLADISSAMFAALSVVTALFQRQKTGAAETIDISMQDCLLSWMSPFVVPQLNQWALRPLPPNEPGYGIFLTQDGQHISLSIAGEDAMWEKLCRLISLVEYAHCRETERAERIDELRAKLRQSIQTIKYKPLADLLLKEGIAFAPMKSVDQLFEDPHLRDRKNFNEWHSLGQTQTFVSQPMKFNSFETIIHSAAPQLGEHNAKFLNHQVKT